MTEQYQFTMEDYEPLYKALQQVKSVCPPDEYQMRHNNLVKEMAEFIIKPYFYAFQVEHLKEMGFTEKQIHPNKDSIE